jgi:hypothetical protein
MTETVRASVSVSIVCGCGRLWRVSKLLFSVVLKVPIKILSKVLSKVLSNVLNKIVSKVLSRVTEWDRLYFGNGTQNYCGSRSRTPSDLPSLFLSY